MKTKYIILFLFLSFLFVGCKSSAKKTTKYLEKGQFEKAFNFSHEKYSKSKISDKEELAPILVNAYEKSLLQNNAKVKQLKLGDLMFNSKEIYYLYKKMADSQMKMELIEPIQSKSKTLKFTKKDYSTTLANAKENMINFSYSKAMENYNKNTVGGYRTAYVYFSDLNQVQPNYKDVSSLMSKSKQLGTLSVQVAFFNNSFQAMPVDFQQDIRNFTNYGLPRDWTNYFFANEGNYTAPDYYIDIYINNFRTNQENSKSEVVTRTKEVSAGFETAYQDGKPITDGNGNVLKKEVFKTVTANLTINSRDLRTYLDAEIRLRGNDFTVENRRISPTTTQRTSQYSYTGDRNALTDEDLQNINRGENQTYDNNQNMNTLSDRMIREMNGIFQNQVNLGLDLVKK